MFNMPENPLQTDATFSVPELHVVQASTVFKNVDYAIADWPSPERVVPR